MSATAAPAPRRVAPTLRDAAGADVPRIAAIYGHHVLHGTESFEGEAPGEAEMARRRCRPTSSSAASAAGR